MSSSRTLLLMVGLLLGATQGLCLLSSCAEDVLLPAEEASGTVDETSGAVDETSGAVDETSGGVDETPIPVEYDSFSLATFNAGLAPIDVQWADERSPHVVAAIADTDFQLLCVQEIWRDSDWEALVAGTVDRLGSAYRLDAVPTASQCTPVELEPLRLCVEAECPSASGSELADCALEGCESHVEALGGACLNCLINEIGGGADLPELSAACLGSSDGEQAASYIYEGAYDVGILTSEEVLVQDALVLDSYLLRASVSYAQIDTDVGVLDVFCTHLASDIPEFEYRGDHGSWQGEQARQLEQVLDYIDTKTAWSGQIVLMGDLNTGPAEGDLQGVWPTHYEQLAAAGFANPAMGTPPLCTECTQNTFHPEGAPETLIDHVLLYGFASDAEAEAALVFTEPVTITADDGDHATCLSDHFGLSVLLQAPAE